MHMPLEKECSKCKMIKDLNKFNKQKTTRDGLAYICKVCSNSKGKKSGKGIRFINDHAVKYDREVKALRSCTHCREYLGSSKKCPKCNRNNPQV